MAGAETDTTLAETFVSHVGMVIDEDGVYPHACICRGVDGGMTIMALDINPREMLSHMRNVVASGDYVDVIFALDRFAKPGQGTTLDDVLTVFRWDASGWRLAGVVEYQHEPRIVKPLAPSEFWSGAVSGDIHRLGASAP